MSRPAFPGFALSLGVLWLLTGALYKLFDGSPVDLPPPVLERSPLDMYDTFRYAILVELAVAGLVLTVPRLGWVLLAGTFATFLAVLAPLAMEGAESCGCFGSNVTIKPWMMMAIDGGLLLVLLFSKPWTLPRDSGLGLAAFLPFLGLAVAAPMMKLPRPELPTPAAKPAVEAPQVGPGSEPAEVAVDVAPPDEVQPAEVAAEPIEEQPVEADPVQEEPEAPEDVAAIDAPEPVAEEQPGDSDLPEFWELTWRDWEGKDFYETDLASFADQSQGAVLPESHVVVYRQTCEVCQEHLEELWEEEQLDPEKWLNKTLVLVRIVENKDTEENNVCRTLPVNYQYVTLPALRRGYGITTPLTFDVDENNLVQNVVDVRKLRENGEGGE
ncbi:MAG: hypothetical protein AAGB93_08815 [Planctomycetota bacterium]